MLLSAAAILAPQNIPSQPSAVSDVPLYGFQIVHAYPHDRRAFTQGLEFRSGALYEGTGLEGRSTLRKEDLPTGKVLAKIDLAPQLFGEGITVLDGRIFQLTWISHRGFIYDQSSFKLLQTFAYPGEGWGLANDGRHIYLSDGTPEIRCLNPETLKEERRFTVHYGREEIRELNELEWVRGELFANIWQTDRIARISTVNGQVLGWIDLAGLLSREDRTPETDVLNGIAYDSAGDRLFVTGKLWPKLFEIRLVPKRQTRGTKRIEGHGSERPQGRRASAKSPCSFRLNDATPKSLQDRAQQIHEAGIHN